MSTGTDAVPMALTRLHGAVFLGALLALGSLASGQWITQSITLRPGWNAVLLQVQPEPNTCDAVFAGIPVDSVWAWNRRFEPIRYVQDAADLEPGQRAWLTYYPVNGSNPAATNLFAVFGGQPYLVKLAGTAEVTLAITGRPTAPRGAWYPDSFNLFGAPVDAASAPTADAFFTPSAAHVAARLHALSPEGRWQEIASLGGFQLTAGRAYWAFCRGPSDYVAPLTVGFEQGSGIDFGHELSELRFYLRNHTSATRTVTLARRDSEPPPGPESPYLAGPVPLSFYRVESDRIGWVPLDASLTVEVAADAETALRLAVRRADMVPFVPPGGPTTRSGVIYASLLDVTDDGGIHYTVPVSSEGLTSFHSEGGELRADDPRVGLWVGYATIDHVGEPGEPAGNGQEANILVGSEFEFRLIVHVDDQLQARLLQQVTLLFQPGQYGPDPVNTGLRIVTEPGRSVLITDDDLISQYSGSALRDGQEVGRRISTVVFAFPRNGGDRPSSWDLSGSFPLPPSTEFAPALTCAWDLAGDDPLNPFRHKYHPDHGQPGQHYTIGREVTMTFTGPPADGSLGAPPALGMAQEGVYEEVLTGLHRDPLAVQGSFLLHKVSSVGQLNR